MLLTLIENDKVKNKQKENILMLGQFKVVLCQWWTSQSVDIATGTITVRVIVYDWGKYV